MDIETTNTLRALFEEYLRNDRGTIIAAFLTVAGMLLVSVVSVVSHWLITKRVVSEEHKRLLIQLHTEARARQHEKWEENILEGIAGLLRATDPEINRPIEPAVVVSFVLKVQLLLNLNDPNQFRVNSLINDLALIANGWKSNSDTQLLLTTHAQLLETAKLLIYRPMNHS